MVPTGEVYVFTVGTRAMDEGGSKEMLKILCHGPGDEKYFRDAQYATIEDFPNSNAFPSASESDSCEAV